MNIKIQNAINEQINKEIYSAYLYLSMAAYFQNNWLSGFSNWMKIQNQEEMSHAIKFYDYLSERGAKIELKQIDAPKIDFKSTLNVLEETLEHEKIVTQSINELYELALNEKDYAFQSFLKWFIDEQVEEESSVTEIIDQIKLAWVEWPGLFMLDKELAGRVFTPPVK